MAKVRILVVCGSGVATSMHVAYKLREYFKEEKIPAVIDGAGNNELAGRIGNYDIVVSNAQVTVKTDKPVFNAVPFLTGIGEKDLIAKIIERAKEIIDEKHGK
ncbi:MAG: PTS sugar transporter subunit IIB [Chloroflexota bacterium]|jgi:PTS system galactitol-specific IIB component|nr:PTS sugar transporter subunit IIB [Chloroflexota bacterium]